MSTTFFPEENWIYCEQHDLTEEEPIDEQDRCYFPPGQTVIKRYPFEANFSNSNRAAILGVLDIPDECSGHMDATQFLQKIDAVLDGPRSPQVDEHTRETYEDATPGKCKLISFGLSHADIIFRLGALRDIAAECQRRGVPIVWC